MNDRQLIIREVLAEFSRDFVFGRTDCCQFAATVFERLSGREARAQFPTYNGEAEAQAVLDQYGGVDGVARSVLGDPTAHDGYQDGDVVLVDLLGTQMLGVATDRFAIVVARNGPVQVSHRHVVHGWRI